MNQETTNPYPKNPYQEDDISLKELILTFNEYFWHILANWKWLLLTVLIFVGLMVGKAYVTPAYFPAKLTFMVNEDDGGSGNILGGILGQFGLGGASGGKYNLDKILELSKSRKIIQMALFEKATINEKNDFIANHIIYEYDFHEVWKEGSLKDFVFTRDSIKGFSRKENKALKKVYNRVLGNSEVKGLLKNSYDEASGIMELRASTTSEGLSLILATTIFEKLSDFYVAKSIEKQESTYKAIKLKTDSLQGALNSAQYQLLKFADQNRGLVLRQDEKKRIQLEQEVQKLIIAYGESYKNQELAAFALSNKTPFIQEIDFPMVPLPMVVPLYDREIGIGLALGLFMGTLIIVVIKVFRDALRGDETD